MVHAVRNVLASRATCLNCVSVRVALTATISHCADRRTRSLSAGHGRHHAAIPTTGRAISNRRGLIPDAGEEFTRAHDTTRGTREMLRRDDYIPPSLQNLVQRTFFRSRENKRADRIRNRSSLAEHPESSPPLCLRRQTEFFGRGPPLSSRRTVPCASRAALA